MRSTIGPMTWAGSSPSSRARRRAGSPAPIVQLNLQPGELVKVKSHDEGLATVTANNFNRGLHFDVEMIPFCGRTFRERQTISKFLDEKTGRMKTLKTPAVILENVWCNSLYSHCKLHGPRSIYIWWREVWLERVETPRQVERTSAADRALT